jgi:hypothetical protein
MMKKDVAIGNVKREWRHILFMRTGGHDWQPVNSNFKFIDHKGQEYVVQKCTQCGMTAQRYGDMESLYVGPQYPREHVIKCPNELGLFKDQELEEKVAVLGGGECKPIKRKKKKGKKDKKKKKGKKNKIIRNHKPKFAVSKIVRIHKPKKVKFTRTKKS